MKIISHKNKLIKFIRYEKSLGFVPTMGVLHRGHISLIKKSLAENNKTIVTIFVNKPQFDRKADYKKYPRVLSKDITLLKKLKVDYLYLPSNIEIYPKGQNKKIKLNSFSKTLCGKFRPNHFESVVDVIDRFINIIKPHRIYLGEKDMQQLKIVENFIHKKHYKTKVVSCKTVREKNGIAYSSRNLLLTLNEKEVASKIYKLLLFNKRNLVRKKLSLNEIKRKILSLGARRVEYIESLNINNLLRPYKKSIKYKIFIAYYLGDTRLIDNI